AQERLHGVLHDAEPRPDPLVHLAHGRLAAVPEDVEDREFARSGWAALRHGGLGYETAKLRKLSVRMQALPRARPGERARPLRRTVAATRTLLRALARSSPSRHARRRRTLGGSPRGAGAVRPGGRTLCAGTDEPLKRRTETCSGRAGAPGKHAAIGRAPPRESP